MAATPLIVTISNVFLCDMQCVKILKYSADSTVPLCSAPLAALPIPCTTHRSLYALLAKRTCAGRPPTPLTLTNTTPKLHFLCALTALPRPSLGGPPLTFTPTPSCQCTQTQVTQPILILTTSHTLMPMLYSNPHPHANALNRQRFAQYAAKVGSWGPTCARAHTLTHTYTNIYIRSHTPLNTSHAHFY